MKKFVLAIFSLLFFITACGPKEVPSIPLKELDPATKYRGELIMSELVKLNRKEITIQDFRAQKFVTPMVHAGIQHPRGVYRQMPDVMDMVLGEMGNYKLFKALRMDNEITRLRFKVDFSKKKNEFVEVSLDLNLNNDLARIYLIVKRGNEWVNLLEY
ncbi:hypothetical protein [Sediminitomix flava]|uniref:Uncharacterized protein n=1 Tax=Sediminitomix flava TaxID=379075 RepID=A0A315Z183_SEDFL|nr:hypothetical protein [Sediminitomix flava]PWJ36174.1 hypothetical protein BC781_109193 [Sediminitomix flava]